MNPLFEVFDGGDFILSSFRDVEEDFTRLRIYLESGDEETVAAASKALAAAMEIVGVDAPLETGEIADEDWKFSYRRHFKTDAIGRRLLVVPVWEMPQAADGRETIVMDPGLAFGTGKHETTRACLEYIDELAGNGDQPPPMLLQASRGTGKCAFETFLDMGCGSGILSIAAAKLGFRDVSGFDVDQTAVDAATENAEANGVEVDLKKFALGRGETFSATTPQPDGKYDVVAANILGPLLIRFADEIVRYVGKRLIISGILLEINAKSLSFRSINRKAVNIYKIALAVRIKMIYIEHSGAKYAFIFRHSYVSLFRSSFVFPAPKIPHASF